MDDLSSDLASLKIDRSPAAARGSALPRVFGSLLVLAALGALGVWLYPRVEAQFFKTEVRTSTVSEVSPSLAVTSLTATGYVVAQLRSKVGANVPGRIAKLHVREGSQVKAGDLLVELEASDSKSRVAGAEARRLAAEAKVASARASLRELQVQLERQRGLLTQNATSRSVVEDLEARIGTADTQVAAAQAEVRAAAAEVQLAKVTLGHMSILAPLDGTVLDKPLDIGETVDAQTPLMEIADLSTQVVEIDVPEARLSLIKVGGPCEITLDAFAGKRFRGEVREIGKRVNRSKATLPVKVGFAEDAAGVLPDMSARVSFLTEKLDEKALAAATKVVLPEAAVVQRNGESSVFVLESGAVKLVSVKLGPKSGSGYELLEGPSPGARVVVNPPETLAAGQRVKERTE